MSRQVATLLANWMHVTQIRDRLRDGVTCHTHRFNSKRCRNFNIYEILIVDKEKLVYRF